MEKGKVNLLILGAPGSGKGTQARMLAEYLDGRLQVVSMGGLLRNESRKHTEVGEEVESVMRAGLLVDDALVCEILFSELRKVGRGFLLDGFPRNLLQAKFLAVVLQLMGCKIDAVIKLEVDAEVVECRLNGRLICRDCGKVSNAGFGTVVCDECGCRDYIRRNDDAAETVKRRIAEYEFVIGELEEYYGELVTRVDSNRSVGEVFQTIKDIVDVLNN